MSAVNEMATVSTAAAASDSTRAGLRPARSMKRAAGPRARVWATAAIANAMPVNELGPLITSTTITGMRALRTPNEFQPCAKFARQAARKRASRSTSRRGPAGSRSVGIRSARGRGLPVGGLRAGSQQHEPDDAGDGEGAGVEEEGRGERDRGEEAADRGSCHSADEEAALVEAHGAGAMCGARRAEQQRHGGDREHGRADSADAAQDQQVRVVRGDPDESARDGHDADSHGEHDSLAHQIDELAHERARDQAHEGERRDDGADLGVADTEAAHEDGQHGHDHAEADHHEERDEAENVDVAGEALARDCD